jgi:hypothetical protein
MAPLALALQLALAAPGVTSSGAPPPTLAPQLDPGPFRGGELAMASLGTLAGDVLVMGAGYLTLQLFAADVFSPTADNFRRAAYVLGAAALIVPPLTAALLARWTGGPGAGRVWKAVLLATVGQAASFAAAYAAAPRLWVFLPVQLAAVSAGASLGLHWGPRESPAARGGAPGDPGVERDGDSTGAATVALFTPICPDR